MSISARYTDGKLELDLRKGIKLPNMEYLSFDSILLICGAAIILMEILDSKETFRNLACDRGKHMQLIAIFFCNCFQFIVCGYRGDPDNRLTMQFMFTNDDTNKLSIRWETWHNTMSLNGPCRSFCEKYPVLRHLCMSNEDALLFQRECEQSQITLVSPGLIVFVDLRSWGAEWYETRTLPNKSSTTYVTTCVYGEFCGGSSQHKCKIESSYPEMNGEQFVVNNWFVSRYGFSTEVGEDEVLVTAEMVKKYSLGPRKRKHCVNG